MVALVLLGAVLVMWAGAVAGIAVALAGGTVAIRSFAALAGVVAVVVMVAGAPGEVVWHARLMTGTAVLTLLLLIAAVVLQRGPARG